MKGEINIQYESIINSFIGKDLLKINQENPIVYLYHCHSSGNVDKVNHYELLVEKQEPYAYKYMKYKMKYLTLKNNMHYNKYL